MMPFESPPKESLFDLELLSAIDLTRIPRHVAIIPDGNRRWARKARENIPQGHQEGADTLSNIIKASKILGIKVLTVYTLSTENLNRSPEEVRFLMWMLESNLAHYTPLMINEGIRLETIGDLEKIPKEVNDRITSTKESTAHCKEMVLVLAVNYGGRDDIRRAVQKILNDSEQGKIQIENITESTIAKYLDTCPYGDPDLLIRAGGELRVSNFLLWQLSYSELYVSDELWPDFTPNHLLGALIDFQKRERRGGY